VKDVKTSGKKDTDEEIDKIIEKEGKGRGGSQVRLLLILSKRQDQLG